jgi:hypothetical protein
MEPDKPSMIRDLVSAIESGNSNETKRLLLLIPFDDMEEVEIYDLLGTLLTEAVDSSFELTMVPLLLEKWGENNFTEDKISTFTMMFIHPQITTMTLARATRALTEVSLTDPDAPEYTFYGSAVELMKYDDRPEITNALIRLTRIFGEQSYEVYDMLMREARDSKAPRIERYMKDMVSRTSPYAPVPDWVEGDDTYTHEERIARLIPHKSANRKWSSSIQDSPGSAITPVNKKMSRSPGNESKKNKSASTRKSSSRSPDAYAHGNDVFELRKKDITEVVDNLTRGLSDCGIVVNPLQEENMRELIRRRISVASGSELSDFISPLEKSIERLDAGQNEKKWFKVLGPVNLITGASLDSDDVCSKWGGCRMFTCNCFERDGKRAGLSFHSIGSDLDYDEDVDEDDDIEVDWFMTRSCHTCGIKIRSRVHALRQPLPHGGWLGAYCSKECLENNLSQEDMMNGITLSVIDIVIAQLNEFKVTNCASEIKDEDEDGGEELGSALNGVKLYDFSPSKELVASDTARYGNRKSRLGETESPATRLADIRSPATRLADTEINVETVAKSLLDPNGEDEGIDHFDGDLDWI